MLNRPWRQYLSTIINFLLPARCLGCGRSTYYLCPECRAALPAAETTEIDDLTAVFNYNDPRAKRAIWLLKYRSGPAIARDLAAGLYEHWLESLVEWQVWHPGESARWLVIPVPLARERQRERGYNQAEMLARALVKLDPANLELGRNLLIKHRHTGTQVGLKNREIRLGNLRDAFSVPEPTLIADKNILLIDDVITTGATLGECRRTLLASGAREALGLAVAHG